MHALRRLTRSFASKLQASSTSNNKDAPGKRLGLKHAGGDEVYPNDILIRQRGMKFKSGINTFSTTDHKVHAKVEGKVKFTKFYSAGKKYTTVHVLPKRHLNSEFFLPRPIMYHPEQFPELAKLNMPFTNFQVPKKAVGKSPSSPNTSADSEPAIPNTLTAQLIRNKTENKPLQVLKSKTPKLNLTQFLASVPPFQHVETLTDADRFQRYEEIVKERYTLIKNHIEGLKPKIVPDH